ncbi:MAG: VWA domain-containing protein [Bacteroidales bacterium]|nr:VWA domain-containing protein [Bacteroidales bacterium]
MKRFFLIAAVLLSGTIIFAQKSPENAKYYIEGNMTIEQNSAKNGWEYKLQDVNSKGITFKKQDVWVGTREGENVLFTFQKAETTYEGGLDATLKFWRYDSESKQWQVDREVKQATESYQTQKIMSIMLVLDCSSSMAQDFAQLKRSAKSFIQQLYGRCPEGNVRLGIIGFNTMKNTDANIFDIQPLTSHSIEKMVSFIDELETDNNTALYYAMDKALDMMTDYANNLRKADKNVYEASCLVAFTDGLDNTSNSFDLGIKNSDQFRARIASRINGEIADRSIESYIIAMKGGDLTNVDKFRKELKEVASEGEHGPNYNEVEDIAKLEEEFKNMAQNLTNRWRDLRCYVPSAREGRVRWTLGEVAESPKTEKKEEKKEEPKPAKDTYYETDLFWGVGAGFFGHGIKGEASRLSVNVCMDFAYPLTQKFAIGGFFSWGIPWTPRVGLLTVIGDYHNKGAILAGIGYACPTGVDLRIGADYKWVYVALDLGSARFEQDFYMAINVGFNFGKFVGKNKKTSTKAH